MNSSQVNVVEDKGRDVVEKILEIAKKEGLSLTPLVMHVNNDFEVNSTIEKIAHESGRIDVLVNNAGYGLLGYFEDLQMEEIRKQFDTNFLESLELHKRLFP